MKKYYYITIVASLAIVCIQMSYVVSLYNNYMAEKVATIDETLHLAIDKELHLRNLFVAGLRPKEIRTITIRPISDISPQELDKLRSLNLDTINVDAAINEGIANTGAEAIMQLNQDQALESGYSLNLQKLDSLLNDVIKIKIHYALFLKDSYKEIVSVIDRLDNKSPNCFSKLYPIGTKGLHYVQLEANIPLSAFIRKDIWILISSVGFMAIAMLCLFFQLTEIRRKTILLRKREESINGTIHDLKAPLNSVLTTLGWLHADEANLPKKKAVEISRAEVRHLVCNIESLLVTVRKDRKRLILKTEEIDILHLAEMVKSSMDALYRMKAHSIEIEDSRPVATKLMADGLYIENVIRNLVENALKYSDSGVEVKITLSVVGNMLQVSVEDNGWGIAPEYQKKLFRQFYQVPRAKERICKGYGIGLAQSKYIIDEHKGKIWVESGEEQGSVFTFTIPLV